MKRTLILMLTLTVAVAAWGQTVREHTVGRGETVASIAAAYGVSQAALLEANPSAAKFIYVGMKLVIPTAPVQEQPVDTPPEEVKTAATTRSAAPVSKAEEPARTVRQVSSTDSSSDGFAGFGVSYIIPFADGKYDAKWGIELETRFSWTLSDMMFATFSLVDFQYIIMNTKGPGYSSTYNIIWPLQLGIGTAEYNFRVGGYLGVLGDLTYDDGSKSYSFKDLKKLDEDLSRFLYGFKFGVTLGTNWDIGFQVMYRKNVSKASNALTLGFRF